MVQNPSSGTADITCENLTDEIIASYADKGFTLVFAEKVMRYDLSRTLPQVAPRSTITYLPWNEQNVHAFFTVYQAAFRDRPGFPGWSEEEWVHWVSDDPTFRPDLSFLAMVEEQPAGFVTNAEDGANGYLIQIGVHPQWRGQKLGAALMVHALQSWREDKKEAVILHVNHNNPAAIHLYEQLGFVVVRERGKFRRQTDTFIS